MSSTNPKGPFKLVTVNTAPERARRLIGRVAEALKDRYTIDHVANCEKIEDVASWVQKFQPNVVFAASMWTPDEAETILSTARHVKPDIATYAIPQGLQVEKGPDAVVEHLIERVPSVLDTLVARNQTS